MGNKVTTIILCVLLSASSGFAQKNPALVSFTGVQIKDSILLQFTLRGGYTCNGIDIFRSHDTINFYLIGDIQGVCGNPNADVSFEFADRFPQPNADNYYRLGLDNYGYSEVLKVYFANLNAAGYSFYPSPCRQICKLYFENPTNKEFEIFLFHYSGKLLMQKTIRGTEFNFSTLNLHQGIYYYRLIKNDDVNFAGKFVVY